MNVAVIFGGNSTEHEISCCSAFNVLENIKGHNVTKIGITKKGEWFFTESENIDIKNGSWEKTAPVTLDLSRGKILKEGKEMAVDVAFPVLHGKNGEDGTIQGLFEMMSLPYVGCGVLASALCMDKISANNAFFSADIPHVKWDYTEKTEFEKDEDAVACRFEKLGYPLFIKPSNAGSSVGISKCRSREETLVAIIEALKVDSRIVAEEGLENFREVEVSIMGNENPENGVVGRIMSANEVYDYDSKYNNPTSQTILPADISPALTEKIASLAKKAYTACGCRGLSRVDFFLDKNENIYINEINTLPGFTSISMFPMAFVKKGMAYSEIIDNLLALALKK